MLTVFFFEGGEAARKTRRNSLPVQRCGERTAEAPHTQTNTRAQARKSRTRETNVTRALGQSKGVVVAAALQSLSSPPLTRLLFAQPNQPPMLPPRTRNTATKWEREQANRNESERESPRSKVSSKCQNYKQCCKLSRTQSHSSSGVCVGVRAGCAFMLCGVVKFLTLWGFLVGVWDGGGARVKSIVP